MTVTTLNLHGENQRISLPRAHWTGKHELSAGVWIKALFSGPKTGRRFAEYLSIWEIRNTGTTRGQYFEELDESEYLLRCEQVGTEPIGAKTVEV